MMLHRHFEAKKEHKPRIENEKPTHDRENGKAAEGEGIVKNEKPRRTRKKADN